MTPEVKIVLKKRFFSLLWKIAGMALTYFLAFVMANINMFGLPVIITTIIGLVVSEITKLLKKNLPELVKK